MITSTVAILFAVGYLLATVWLCRGIRLTARDLCLGGIVCAMTLVLATIRIPLPTGSNITCGSWIPLMLLALLYDYRLSMLSGWVCGILAMVLIPAWQPVHWAQIFVEHLVCFSCLGYTGIFGTDKRWKILCGGILAIFIKFWAHVLTASEQKHRACGNGRQSCVGSATPLSRCTSKKGLAICDTQTASSFGCLN